MKKTKFYVATPVRFGQLIVFVLVLSLTRVLRVVTESSIRKSGFTLIFGLGRTLYRATFRGLYPTTIGGNSGGYGGLVFLGGGGWLWAVAL